MSNIVAHSERWLVSPPSTIHRHCYLVVLTRGAVDDYAAYAGVVCNSECVTHADIEFVAEYGDKISEKEARLLFLLPKDIYYRR